MTGENAVTKLALWMRRADDWSNLPCRLEQAWKALLAPLSATRVRWRDDGGD